MMRRLILAALFGGLLVAAPASAALTIGTNAGFVTVAPTADPTATGTAFRNDTLCVKDTFPALSGKVVTEIGFWLAGGTGAVAYAVTLYADDGTGNAPGAVISTFTGQTTGATGAWYAYTGLSIPVTASTAYWACASLGDVTSQIDIGNALSGNYVRLDETGTTAPDPFGTPTSSDTRTGAVYAVYGDAPVGGSHNRLLLLGIGDASVPPPAEEPRAR